MYLYIHIVCVCAYIKFYFFSVILFLLYAQFIGSWLHKLFLLITPKFLSKYYWTFGYLCWVTNILWDGYNYFWDSVFLFWKEDEIILEREMAMPYLVWIMIYMEDEELKVWPIPVINLIYICLNFIFSMLCNTEAGPWTTFFSLGFVHRVLECHCKSKALISHKEPLFALLITSLSLTLI